MRGSGAAPDANPPGWLWDTDQPPDWLEKAVYDDEGEPPDEQA